MVLAVLTVQVTPREKDGTGPVGSSQGVFLTVVWSRAGDNCFDARLTESFIRIAIGTAFATTQLALSHLLVCKLNTPLQLTGAEEG
jgi:hypothetical protein